MSFKKFQQEDQVDVGLLICDLSVDVRHNEHEKSLWRLCGKTPSPSQILVSGPDQPRERNPVRKNT